MTRPHARASAIAAALALALAGCAREPAAIPAALHATTEAPAVAAATPPTAAPAATGDADLARAQAAAMDFSGRLRGELQAAMAAGGPVAAVAVCHEQAPRIAGAVMAEHGVRQGRVALPGRNRHPAQAAGDWQRGGLEGFQRSVDAGAPTADQAAVLREGLPDGVALRMMRGIATEPGCLACHGRDVAAPVRDAIARHYPDDHATGFGIGDLRGALWVEVPDDGATQGGTP